MELHSTWIRRHGVPTSSTLRWAPVGLGASPFTQPFVSLHPPSIGLIVSFVGSAGLMLEAWDAAWTEEEEEEEGLLIRAKGRGPQSGWKWIVDTICLVRHLSQERGFQWHNRNPSPLHLLRVARHSLLIPVCKQGISSENSLNSTSSPSWDPEPV